MPQQYKKFMVISKIFICIKGFRTKIDFLRQKSEGKYLNIKKIKKIGEFVNDKKKISIYSGINRKLYLKGVPLMMSIVIIGWYYKIDLTQTDS